jgi:hypothetical protein
LNLLILFLLISLSAPYTVYGEAVNASPVANASITLTDATGILTVTTDADGYARFLARPTSHNIIVSAIGSLEGVANIDFSVNSSVEVALDPAPVIKGRVTVNGSPVYGVQVLGAGSTVITDSDGYYYVPTSSNVGDTVTLNFYPLGNLWLYKYMQNYIATLSRLNMYFTPPPLTDIQYGVLIPSNANAFAVGRTVDIPITDMVVEYNIDLEPSFKLSGYITDGSNPVPYAFIFLLHSNLTKGLTAMSLSDENGYYEVNYNLEAGTYNITVYAPGFSYFSQSITITGDTVLDIVLEPSPILEGRVVSQDGKPVQGASVTLFKSGAMPVVARTNETGYFYFDSLLSPGDWNVMVVYPASIMLPITSNATVTLSPGYNFINITMPVTQMEIRGVLDDVDRDGLLEGVQITVEGTINLGFLTYNISVYTIVYGEGNFSIYVPTTIIIQGVPINVTSFNVKVRSGYYYPLTTVVSDIPPDDIYDLGVVQVSAGNLIEVTIRVLSNVGVFRSIMLHYPSEVEVDGNLFNINIVTNSCINGLYYGLGGGNGTILIVLSGQGGTGGFVTLEIPKGFMDAPYTVFLDGSPAIDVSLEDIGTHIRLTVSYSHSYRYIMIQSTNAIPEFPSIYLAIIMVSIAIVILIWRRR